MKRTGKITQKELESKGWVALEDILPFLNGGRYERFFLRKPREAKDGSREFLTKKGRLYGRLVAILSACARSIGDEDAAHDMEAVVEDLDQIVGEQS